MRQSEKQTTAESSKAKSVRFAALIASAGKPEVYLPLFDPWQDRAFMRAVKEKRVLSIRQEPVSRHSDYGVVGFDEGKHMTYLVFPKPLTEFAEDRVIGIKYDVVASSDVAASATPRELKTANTRAEKRPRAAKAERSSTSHRLKPARPARSDRVESRPKEFRVHLKITRVTEKDVTVTAMTKAEARKKAQAVVERDGEARATSVTER